MTLTERVKSDLTTAMKAGEKDRVGTLRLVLSELQKAAKEGSDDDVLTVLTREAKKRREAAEAFDGAGRGELADNERAEQAVLEDYLPAQLSDEELAALVAAAIGETGSQGQQAMGQVMKAVQPKVAGRAEGSRIAAEVRRQLA